jgi:flavin-dependent dehydrogenase
MAAFDAIAIGGGVAGAAFALELARNGARVLVIERSRGPQLKVCGEFLSGESEALLGYLGIDLWALGAARISCFRLEAEERSASFALPFRAAGLSRSSLDEALLAAGERAGASIERGVVAKAIAQSGGRVEVVTGGKVFRGRNAALATGKHDLRDCRRARGALAAFKQRYAPTRAAANLLRDHVALVLYDGGYLGACMTEGGTATVCWLADAALMQRTGGRWQAQLDGIARSSSFTGDLLTGAQPVSDRPAAVSCLPFGYRRRQTIAPHVYPLGDQLAVIPSFAGDGTCLALASGIGAAQAVLRGQAAAEFQADFMARTAAQFRWAQAVDWGLRRRPVQRLALTALSVLPQIAGRLAQSTRTVLGARISGRA